MTQLKNSFRRSIVKASLGVVAIAGISTIGFVSVASADKYPSKPIELVIHAKYVGELTLLQEWYLLEQEEI